MATERLFQALVEVTTAQRELQRWTRQLDTAKRLRDSALQEQDRLKGELMQIERALGTGATMALMAQVPGTQQTFNVRGRTLRQRRAELLRALNARPDQPPLQFGYRL